jgi:acylglycerol lipase
MRRLAALLLILTAAACAPHLAPPGPGLHALGLAGPRLTDDAFVTDDGLTLPLRIWRPNDAVPKAVILALHGFNDYSNAFEDAGAYWAKRRIAVYAYDQRGFGAGLNHGLWAGSGPMIDDLVTAARLLRARYPHTPLYLLGDSMGGAVILAAAGSDTPPPADGVILAAPAVWARETMPLSYRIALWLGSHTIPWATVTGRGLKIQASDNIEMLRALGRDPLVIKATRIDAIHGLVDLMDQGLAAAPHLKLPALLLYGAKDEIVPEDPTLDLWESLPEADRRDQRCALYNNGWHMLLRDLEGKVVWNDIADWIADPAAPLPSGADKRALARLNGGAPS